MTDFVHGGTMLSKRKTIVDDEIWRGPSFQTHHLYIYKYSMARLEMGQVHHTGRRRGLSKAVSPNDNCAASSKNKVLKGARKRCIKQF